MGRSISTYQVSAAPAERTRDRRLLQTGVSQQLGRRRDGNVAGHPRSHCRLPAKRDLGCRHRRKREKLDWVIADDASRSAVGHPWSRALRLVLDGPTLLLKSEQRGYQDVARGRHSFPRF